MGLLDLNDSDRSGAMNMGLLSAGLSMLGGRGNGRQNIAQGGMVGINAYQNALEQAQKEKMEAFRRQQIEAQMAQQQQQEAMKQQFLQDPRIPAHIRQGVAAGVIDLADLMKPQKMGEGDTLVSPMNQMMGMDPVIARGAPKTQQPTAGVQDYEYAKQQGFQGSYQDWVIQKARAGASSMNVTQPYEKEFDKQRGALDARTLDDLRSKANAGRDLLRSATRLEQLNEGVYAGGGAGAKLAAANFLQGLGINVGDPAKVANSQEFDAIATKSVLDQLGGSLGTGVSNADVDFIKKTVPQLGNSVAARKAMIDFMRAKGIQQIQNFEAAMQHANQHGNLMGWKPARQVLRRGMYGGKQVVEYDDGSVEYAD